MTRRLTLLIGILSGYCFGLAVGIADRTWVGAVVMLALGVVALFFGIAAKVTDD